MLKSLTAAFISVAILSTIFMSFTGGGFEARAQAAAAPYVKATSALLWDAVTQDIAGNPEVVAAYDLALTLSGSDLVLRPADPIIATQTVTGALPPTSGVQLAALLTGRSPGPYRLWVRAIDAAGNQGLWSLPLDIQHDNVVPAAPKNLKLQLSVTVGP